MRDSNINQVGVDDLSVPSSPKAELLLIYGRCIVMEL